MNMRLSIVVAHASNHVIGRAGKIPWRLKPDFRHFRNLTLGHPVIMGRKTYDSLEPPFKPLPERRNIVATRQENFQAPGCTVCHSLEAAIEEARSRGAVEAFLIGGAELYQQALEADLVDRIYLTEIGATPPGDAYFPALLAAQWQETTPTEAQTWLFDQKSQLHYRFRTFERRQNSYVDLRSTKSHEYQRVLEVILAQGVCPFCPDHFNWHPKPIIWQNLGWRLTEIAFPYEGAERHYLLIPDCHMESLTELRAEDWMTIGDAGRWLITHQEINGGALALRFGDPKLTGATVRHLHCHIIVPKAGQVVNFPIG